MLTSSLQTSPAPLFWLLPYENHLELVHLWSTRPADHRWTNADSLEIQRSHAGLSTCLCRLQILAGHQSVASLCQSFAKLYTQLDGAPLSL